MGEEGQAFKEFIQNHYKVMHRLGMTLMSYIAEGLGKDAHYFDHWFEKDTCSTLRLIHYMPRSQSSVSQESLSKEDLRLTTPKHTDSGFLTLLSTFMYPGL